MSCLLFLVPEVAPQRLDITLSRFGIPVITWQPIPNDIELYNAWYLIGYNITLTEIFPEPGQKSGNYSLSFIVTSSTTATEIPGYFTLYELTISGVTAKGSGVKSSPKCLAGAEQGI